MRIDILALTITVFFSTIGLSSPLIQYGSDELLESFGKRDFDINSSLEEAYGELKSLFGEMKGFVENDKVYVERYGESQKVIKERVASLKKYVETKLFPTSWKYEFSHLQNFATLLNTAKHYRDLFEEEDYNGSDLVEKVVALNIRIDTYYTLQEDTPAADLQSKLETLEQELERLKAQGEKEIKKTGQVRRMFDNSVNNARITLGNVKNNCSQKQVSKKPKA